jgi:hypothetical protein
LILRVSSFVFLLGSLWGSLSFGFPELIRHGYGNCISCHVSPNGGGLVTPYGRALSEEVLSSWHQENESKLAWGLVTPPEWLNVGGDFRAVQTRLDTPTVKMGKFVIMQADAEAAATVGEFIVLATLGKSNNPEAPKFIDNFLSRRHFVLYHPKEELYFRAGKFQKAFGINIPEHNISTKQGLGWNYGTETYNVEAAWLDSNKDIFLTAVLGRPDSPDLNREKGISARGGYQIGETHKLGMSYFYGTNSNGDRHVAGPYALLGFRKDLFLLAEVDFQSKHPNLKPSSWGWANYGRLDYELFQGLHFYLTQDMIKTDFKDNNTLVQNYGGGIQWFPRPHFELVGTYEKQKNLQIQDDSNDFFWLVVHFYL